VTGVENVGVFIGEKFGSPERVQKRQHIRFRRKGNHPEESIEHKEEGESLKSRTML